MFSVIIPLYNKEQSVTNTLQSVLNQTFAEFEVVIVNDGSTDNSVEKVEAFKDPRIRLIHQANAGVSAARNKGIEEAKHEWIAFLDGDDLWMEEHLQVLNQMIQEYPEYKVFCTSYIRSNQMLPAFQDASIIVIEDYFKEAIKGHFFWTSVACIHISVFEEVGGFNDNLNRGEDLELWTRIGRKFSFVRSNKITGMYRVEAENRSDLNFILEKSRVFNYNFNECTSDTERAYYKKQISRVLRSFLKQKNINNFLKLKQRHKTNVRFRDILKR